MLAEANLAPVLSSADDSKKLAASFLGGVNIIYYIPDVKDEEIQNVSIEVEMSDKSLEYFNFNEKTMQISSKKDILMPPDDYEFTIILDDNHLSNPKSSHYKLVIKILPELTASVRKNTEYATPKIKHITTLGEAIVHWDRSMKLPGN